MIFKKMKFFWKEPDHNKDVNELWEEYLSSKPSTGELARLLFLNDKKELCKLAWKELKSRSDIENEELLDVVLFCRKPEWISKEAWKMLSERNPKEHHLERIVSNLGATHPISKDIEMKFGKNRRHILSRIEALL